MTGLELHAVFDGYALSFVTPADREVVALYPTLCAAAEALRAAKTSLHRLGALKGKESHSDVRRI